MSAPPYMPLYVADYLGDTRHLTTEQHGAYLLLLMAMWRAGGRLPREGQKLARMAGLTAAKWDKLEADILEFFDVDGLSIVHGRITKELEKCAQTSAKRSQSGERGGRAKALKNNNAGVANATILPEQKASISEPEPRVEEANASLSSPDDAPSPRQYPEPFELAWKAYPHTKGRSSKPKALGYWRRLPASDRDRLPRAIARYAREGREPKADCGAPAFDRWLKDARYLDWFEATAQAVAPRPEPAVFLAHVRHFHDTGEWRPNWGPRPDEVTATTNLKTDGRG